MTQAETLALTQAGRSGRGADNEVHGGRDRFLEIIAVLLLGITTLGTAWCGYEAAQWSGQSSDLAREASDDHVEAARLFGVATQKVSYDSNLIAQYAQAKAAGQTQLMDFYRKVLIRPDFLPVLDKWEDDIAAGRTPVNLLEDPDYLTTQLADYNAMVAKAETASSASTVAGDNASRYVGVTILLATALFFAGVTSSFRYRPAKVFLITAALVTMAYAAARLSTLPVQL